VRPDGPKSGLPTTPLTHPLTDDGAPPIIPRGAEPELGTHLGQFRVEARLGQGGLGIVYRAYDEKLKRDVALKVLLEPSVAAGAHLLEEARAAASLTHPSIAAIHDVQQQNGIVFIVMELVPGTTLRAEIKRGPIEPATVARYARDIAAGLSRAQERRRAPGPQARERDDHAGRDREDPRLRPGARGARNPTAERRGGGDGDLRDARLHGAGASARGACRRASRRLLPRCGPLRDALGSTPVRAAEDRDISLSDAWRVLARLETVAPGVPEELTRIVERCLALDRGTRFANGGEVLDALRALDGPEKGPAERAVADARSSTVTPAPAPRSSAPRRFVAATGATLVVVLAIGAVAVLRVTRQGAPTAPRALADNAAAPTADDPRRAALRDELEHARSAWRAGDEGARGMLEQIVHEVEHTGAHASMPQAQVAAEAVFLLGDLDEKEVVAPAPREPTTTADLGPGVIFAAQDAGTRAARRYSEISLWGPPLGLVVCGLYRAGRIAEKLSAIARVAEARDLAAMQQASIEALYPGGWAQLKLGWSASLSSFRAQASGFYDAAVSTARYVDGPITDPADGSDCRVAALARRDAISTDGGS
jgi:serine/threonine-protein kinase